MKGDADIDLWCFLMLMQRAVQLPDESRNRNLALGNGMLALIFVSSIVFSKSKSYFRHKHSYKRYCLLANLKTIIAAGHIKDPNPLIGKSRASCHGGRFSPTSIKYSS